MERLIVLLQSGFGSVAAYLAAHVLLCLVPAFFVAGALSALVPQAAVVRYLGPGASRCVAYPAAAGAGSLLAVCSCTVQPLFAGIYKQGAGLGPAITFLFFAPAANILALSYTGVALGPEFAAARVLFALSFGVGIGMIMATLFRRAELQREGNGAAFAATQRLGASVLVFLLALVALLIAGTLKVDALASPWASVELPWSGARASQAALDRLLPVDALKGDEGLRLQGVLLIGLLALIGMTAWRGLGRVDEGFSRLTFASLGLIAATLFLAALAVTPTAQGLQLGLTGRSVVVALLMVLVGVLARRFDPWDLQQWL